MSDSPPLLEAFTAREAVQGIGERIAARAVPKMLLLNGSHDRETSASAGHAGPMGAADVVTAVVDALNRRHGKRGPPLGHPPAAYVTAVLAPAGGALAADAAALAALGIQCAPTHLRVSDEQLAGQLSLSCLATRPPADCLCGCGAAGLLACRRRAGGGHGLASSVRHPVHRVLVRGGGVQQRAWFPSLSVVAASWPRLPTITRSLSFAVRAKQLGRAPSTACSVLFGQHTAGLKGALSWHGWILMRRWAGHAGRWRRWIRCATARGSACLSPPRWWLRLRASSGRRPSPNPQPPHAPQPGSRPWVWAQRLVGPASAVPGYAVVVGACALSDGVLPHLGSPAPRQHSV